MTKNLTDLLNPVFDAVLCGGAYLLQQRSSGAEFSNRPTIDVLVGEMIMKRLSSTNIPVYSEEVDVTDERVRKQEFWWVDPIDGTRGYLNGEKEYSISVGLVVDHVPVLGVLYQPEFRKLYYAVRGEGAKVKDLDTMEEKVLFCSLRGDAEAIAVLGTQSHENINEIYGCLKLSRKLESMGSFTAKVLAIAEGRGDIYVKLGDKCNEWDSCAVDVILQEAGGIITDIEGNRLLYNKPDPKQGIGVVVSNNSNHRGVVDTVRDYILKRL